MPARRARYRRSAPELLKTLAGSALSPFRERLALPPTGFPTDRRFTAGTAAALLAAALLAEALLAAALLAAARSRAIRPVSGIAPSAPVSFRASPPWKYVRRS